MERYRHPFQVAHFVVCSSVPEAGPASRSVKIARLRAPRKSLLCWESLGPRAILGMGTRGLSVSSKEPPLQPPLGASALGWLHPCGWALLRSWVREWGKAASPHPPPWAHWQEPKGQMETNEHLAAAGNFPFCSGGCRKEAWVSWDSKFGNVCSAEHKSLPLVLRTALTPFLDSCCVPSASVCEAGGEDLVSKEETDELLPQTIPAYSAPGIVPGLGAQRSSDRPSQTLHPRPGFSSISHPENLLEHRWLGAILPPSTPTPNFRLSRSEVGPGNLHLQ